MNEKKPNLPNKPLYKEPMNGQTVLDVIDALPSLEVSKKIREARLLVRVADRLDDHGARNLNVSASVHNIRNSAIAIENYLELVQMLLIHIKSDIHEIGMAVNQHRHAYDQMCAKIDADYEAELKREKRNEQQRERRSKAQEQK